MVQKSRVENLIMFLVKDNVHYTVSSEFHGFSQSNLDALFYDLDHEKDKAVPCGIKIGFLAENDAVRGATLDYFARNDDGLGPGAEDKLLMENVGYTDGDDMPRMYEQMKIQALRHCLMGGRYL